VKYHRKTIVDRLLPYPINQETYDKFRETIANRPLERAIRFLYLNRTAFGGMYRLNQLGMFNVPFGGGERTTAPLWKYGLLSNAAKALRRAKLKHCDFEIAMSTATTGDLVYCDPTYTVAHNNNGFVRYNERNFSWKDQERLARAARNAAERGAVVIVSNAFYDEIIKLFSPPEHVIISRKSRLCPQVRFRRPVDEYLFIFPPRRR